MLFATLTPKFGEQRLPVVLVGTGFPIAQSYLASSRYGLERGIPPPQKKKPRAFGTAAKSLVAYYYIFFCVCSIIFVAPTCSKRFKSVQSVPGPAKIKLGLWEIGTNCGFLYSYTSLRWAMTMIWTMIAVWSIANTTR